MSKTSKAVATLAPERIDNVAIINPSMVDPENPGKILAGCQLKTRKAADTPETMNERIAILNWLGSPWIKSFKDKKPIVKEATTMMPGI